MDKSEFSNKLILLRGDKSRNSVADEIGINPQTLERYEKNKRLPDIEITSKIADYYDVSVDWLLGTDKKQLSERELITEISSYLGLNKTTVELLHALKEKEIDVLHLLSELICNNDSLDIIRTILILKNESERMRQSVTNFIENGSLLSFSDKDLDVSRYAIHRILERILDNYDLRCESDYHDLKSKVIEHIDASLFDPKK